jgi:hypothetical protein
MAAELFATTADAHVLLGNLPEDPAADWTADRRPLTTACALQRLARQVCADANELTGEELLTIAKAIRDVQLDELTRSIEVVTSRMPAAPASCIVSGSGQFLAEEVARRVFPTCRIVALTDEIGREPSRCAPAHAAAVLARELGKRGKL